MTYILETATRIDTDTAWEGMPEFHSSPDVATLPAALGNLDLAIKFGGIIAGRVLDSEGNMKALWTPQDGIQLWN